MRPPLIGNHFIQHILRLAFFNTECYHIATRFFQNYKYAIIFNSFVVPNEFIQTNRDILVNILKRVEL